MNSSRKPRKRKTPLHTTLPSSPRVQSENIKLLNIFPDMVWILILKSLAHCPYSLQTIANSSLVLRHFLKRSNFFAGPLFPLVWPSFYKLVKHQEHNKTFKRYYSAMLRCRKVCQNWCGSISRYFQDHPDRFPNVNSHFDSTPNKKAQKLEYISPNLKLSCKFNKFCQPKLLKFLPHFHTTHAQTFRSPFISGEVSFTFCGNQPTDMLQAQLLEVYGHHVLHCTLEICLSNGMYNRLVHTLQHMPNIKTLSIKGLGYERVADWLIPQYNLPWLENLISLKFDKAREPFWTELFVRHSPALRYLEFVMTDFREPLPFTPSRTCNLIHLKVSLKNCEDVWLFDTVQTVKSVEVHFNWQLEWPLFHVLETLEAKLPESCRSLVLLPVKVPMQETSQLCRLKLKSLERLSVYLHNNVPIDFVLGMRDTLRVLHVRYSSNDLTYQTWIAKPWARKILQNEEIKFLSCWGHLNMSNIWQLFPKLQILKVGHYIPDGFRDTKLEVTCWIKKENNFEKRVWLVDGYQRPGNVTKYEVPF